MRNDVKHLFICLFAICIFLLKHLFKVFGPFSNWIVWFLLLGFKVLCVFWKIVLFEMGVLWIFLSVSCLSTLLTLSLKEQKVLLLMTYNLSVISFMDCAILVLSKMSSFSWVYTFPFFPCLSLLFFPQWFVKPPWTTTLPPCNSLSLGWFWSLPLVQCYRPHW